MRAHSFGGDLASTGTDGSRRHVALDTAYKIQTKFKRKQR